MREPFEFRDSEIISRLGQVEEWMREDSKKQALELAEMREDSKNQAIELAEMREDFKQQAIELAELRSAVEFGLSITKWGGALLLVTVLFSVMAGIWWASNMDTNIRGTNARLESIDARLRQ